MLFIHVIISLCYTCSLFIYSKHNVMYTICNERIDVVGVGGAGESSSEKFALPPHTAVVWHTSGLVALGSPWRLYPSIEISAFSRCCCG